MKKLARPAAALLLAFACLAPTGCKKEESKPAAAAPAAMYTTRGRVERVVSRPGTQTLLQVHHEEIPSFKNREGAVIGMKEMVMDFPLATGVRVDDLKTGDVIEVEFAVDWSQTPYHAATKVTKLPADTALKLGKFVENGK